MGTSLRARRSKANVRRSKTPQEFGFASSQLCPHVGLSVCRIQTPFRAVQSGLHVCARGVLNTPSLGWADKKREHCAQEHDYSNNVESVGIVACVLAHVSDKGRPR